MITWAVLLYMSARITGSHLKALNYSLSRHRHLSFRLLLTQTYIWAAALGTWGFYRYHQCMAILHEHFNFLQNSTLFFLLFSTPPKDGSSFYSLEAWEGQQRQLATFMNSEYLPPLGFFTYVDLVTLSAIAFLAYVACLSEGIALISIKQPCTGLVPRTSSRTEANMLMRASFETCLAVCQSHVLLSETVCHS